MRTPASYRYRYKYKYVYINRMWCHVRSKRKETFKTHNVRFGFIEWGNLWELNSKHYGRIVIRLLRVSNVHIHVYIGKCKQAGSQASWQSNKRAKEHLCVWFLFSFGDGFMHMYMFIFDLASRTNDSNCIYLIIISSFKSINISIAIAIGSQLK